MPKERQTCTECSMRRQKCDRNLPCSRCLKRGEPEKCTREWPKEGYDPKKHRIYPRPEKSDHNSPSASSGQDGSQQSPLSISGRQPEVVAQNRQRNSELDVLPRRSMDWPQPDYAGPSRAKQSASIQEKEVSVLDLLTEGRGNLTDYQLKSFDLLKEPFKNNKKSICMEQEYSNGFGNTNSQQISFLQLLLPQQEQVFSLVEYHISSILWYHGSFHGDSFRNELQAQCRSPNGLQIRDVDLRWGALLFAIMAGSMICAPDHLTIAWGFPKSERCKLPRQWYKASLTCLNLADYMWRHHLWSVSTICVLTMSGHVLGFSNTQSTLHGASLKIAQGLGLQRIGPEADESILSERDLTPAKREKIIRREMGRRVWAQVCNQDWFSIPFSEMYSIQKAHFSTSKPQHIDERTLLPVPVNEPSLTSFTRCLNEIASIIPQNHDALAMATTLYTKYEQVLHHDAKMKQLEREGIPSFLSITESLRPEWPEWIPWARRSLKLCIAHKTIMIHRSFLGKSLTDRTFDHTRKTCMEASKTILREARQAQDLGEGPMLWIDQAFMVAAGITLSLDIFHRKPTEPEYEDHRKHVESTINMLGKFENSMIATRGVRLLTSLLTEQARLSAAKSMESYNKKRARDAETGQAPEDIASTPGFVQVDGGSFSNAMKRQKFDVPKFLENFVGSDSNITSSLKSTFYGNPNGQLGNSMDVAPAITNSNSDMVLGNGQLGNVLMQQQSPDRSLPHSARSSNPPDLIQSGRDALGLPVEYGYDDFEQIFPPHAGMKNEPNDIPGHASATNARFDAGSQRLLGDSSPAQQPNDKQLYPGGKSYLTSAFLTQSQSSIHPLPNETPAQKRFRELFISRFMDLKQPEIPGIWSSWDPVKGVQQSAQSDWPQHSSGDSRAEDFEAQNHARAEIPNEDDSITAGINVVSQASLQHHKEDDDWVAQRRARYIPAMACFPDWESNIHDDDPSHAPPNASGQNKRTASTTSIPKADATMNKSGDQPSQAAIQQDSTTPDRRETKTSSLLEEYRAQNKMHRTPRESSVRDLRYRSPPQSPKRFRPDTDMEKDAQSKRIISEAQKTYSNGPMWGVATKPPVTFDPGEDYSDVFAGDKAVESDLSEMAAPHRRSSATFDGGQNSKSQTGTPELSATPLKKTQTLIKTFKRKSLGSTGGLCKALYGKWIASRGADRRKCRLDFLVCGQA